MSMISLKLPGELAARLEDAARAHQKPKSALVREFIEHGLQGNTRKPPSFYELARTKCGLGRSGIRDLATHRKHLRQYGQ